MSRARDNAMGIMPGNVIQIARHEWRNETNNTSGSYVTLTGSSFTFTPKIATSKILLVAEIAAQPTQNATTYAGMNIRLHRDGAVLEQPGQAHEIYFNNGGGAMDAYTRSVKSQYFNTNSVTPTVFTTQVLGYAGSNARVNQGGQWLSCYTIYEVAQ
jgi:hypothetical protein